MPRFNPPPGWDVPPDFMPPVGWRPDPHWPPVPRDWQMWIVDPVLSARSVDDTRRNALDATIRRRPTPAPIAYAPDATQAWSPTRDRRRPARDQAPPQLSTRVGRDPSTPDGEAPPNGPASPPTSGPPPHPYGSAPGARQHPHHASAPAAHSSGPSAGSPMHPERAAADRFAPSSAPRTSLPASFAGGRYPVPGPGTEPEPWYSRAAPAAVAASTCVAVVAVSIWAFVLREGPAGDQLGPGKFDVEPPEDPDGSPIGGAQGDDTDELPGPSELPQVDDPGDDVREDDTDDGSSEDEGAGEDDDGPELEQGEGAGLTTADSFPQTSSDAHLGPDGVPTNTEPIGTLDDLELLSTDRFAHGSILPWTATISGSSIRAQFVGDTLWDASTAVAEADATNPPPPDGHVYVTQRVRVSNEGERDLDAFGSLLVYWVTDEGDVYAATSATAPDDLVRAPVVGQGEEVQGNLVLCLPEEVLEDGYWAVGLFHSSNSYLMTPRR